jgi:CheY-like chemotaxis protein
MKILVADDQDSKQESLTEFIVSNFKDTEIDHSYSFKGTRDKIIKNRYDLVLLDMTMPSFDSQPDKDNIVDGKNRALAGKDIIQTMAYRQIIYNVIIVTQFDVFGRHYQMTSIDEIIEPLVSDYPEIVKGYVLWDYQSDTWKTKLLNMINGLMK